MLSISNYSKSYNNQLVLKIPKLEFEKGIFWIRGANGSGKSTMLKTIAGIIDFDGDIFLDQNISIKKHPVTYRKKVNFAEAEPAFPEFLTGKEMIRLFSSAKSASKNQEECFIEEMGMNSYIGEPLGTYSSGMLKKLSIVLAFIGNPEIILLDEPLITIDTESLKTLYRWIENKHRLERTSFFLSSHQPLEINNAFTVKELLVENQIIKYKD